MWITATTQAITPPSAATACFTAATVQTGLIYILPLTDTYWMQLIDEYDMELCVNNSSRFARAFGKGNVSGSTRDQAYDTRACQLHNDHTGEQPCDIISIYIGFNDHGARCRTDHHRQL